MKASWLLVALAFALTACGGSSPFRGPVFVPNGAHPQSGSMPITHVVVIMQENRSFDNFFHDFPGADGADFGYGHGVKYTLQPLHLKWTFDLNHFRWQFLEDYDLGNNDGWDNLIQKLDQPPPNGSCPYNDPYNHPACWIFWTGKTYQKMAFSYTIRSEIQPYWTMAKEYTLGDHNFGSTDGPSFGPHQMLIAGQDGNADEVPVLMPWGCDATKNMNYNWENYLHSGQATPPEFPAAYGHDVIGARPCFTYPTVANLLDNANVSWRWYKEPAPTPSHKTDSWWLDAFDAIKQIRYGPDYKNVVTPDWQVLTDISGGNLAHVSWVMPHGGASDHPGSGSGDCGPAWITGIVNAIGKSQYWKSTAIIITWDEWGGWFDHEVPPQIKNKSHVYEGLGYRVPLIIVSPYAKNRYISKSQHETASALHFIEKVFNLGNLGQADVRADAYDDIFDFSKQPTTFKPIPKPSNYASCMTPSKQNSQPEMDY
jgi:phospholipase C